MAKSDIVKKDWVAQFQLVGKPVINDFTFDIDKQSAKSNYIYNKMRLGVDCGSEYGTVYCESIGGYSPDNPFPIYARDKEDFSTQIVVDWEDRFDSDTIDQVSDLNKFTVGLEKKSDGNTYYQDFLSEYDAIAYIQEHLTPDMVVNVKGTLKYSLYEGKTQIRKEFKSIALSKAEPENYRATFQQSILIDGDSASLTKDNIDTDKGVMYVNARVLDYLKEYNGEEVRGQFPFVVRLEQEMPFGNQELCKKRFNHTYKVKKGITQVNMEGVFIESGAAVQATKEDIPDDIMELVDLGYYTMEEALAKCSTNGNRERRMVLKKPQIKMVGDEDNKIPNPQMFTERYTEEDLLLDCFKSGAGVKQDDNVLPWDEEDSSNEDSSWLDELV